MVNRIDFVVTARPSWSRVRSLVENYAAIAGLDAAKLIFIDTANSRNYGDVSKQSPGAIRRISLLTHFDSDSFDGTALSVSSGIEALARYWALERPDASVVIADRTETLGVAAAAAVMQIPLIHLQGGEITGSIDNKVRNANSALADFHLTTNEESATRLQSLGVNRDLIRITGCPSLDIAREVLESGVNITNTRDLGGTGNEFSLESSFGIIMFHPDTLNLSETEQQLVAIVEAIKNIQDLQWIWFWPNSDHGSAHISKQMRVFRESTVGKKVKFLVNVRPEIFIKLAHQSSFIIGNSSFGIREASFLGLPAINIGERQKNRQRAANVVDLRGEVLPQDISLAIRDCLSIGRFPSSKLYGDGYAGVKGARFLVDWQPELGF